MSYALNSGENLLFKFGLFELTSGLTWKGVYDNATAYVVNDAVLGSNNLGYKCILAGTGHPPPNATYWTALPLIAAVDIKDALVELVDANGDVIVKYLYARGADQTTGTLTVGQPYIIANFQTGDDFTNVGASSNATGVMFTATGDTPTDWTHGSVLQPVTLPDNITITDGLFEAELLRADTKPLDGDYELRITLSFVNPIFIQSGAQTDVLCLPEALSITPC